MSNISGENQLYHFDTLTRRHRQVTSVASGVSTGAICPDGRSVWWFRDRQGDEHGRWQISGVTDGSTRSIGGPGHPNGIALRAGIAVLGMSSARNSTIAVWPSPETGVARTIFEDPHRCSVVGISADDTLVCLTHQRDTDARHPTLLITDLYGKVISEWCETGPRRLWPGPWSPVRGDCRLIVHHEPDDRRRPAVWHPGRGAVRTVEIDLPGDVSASWYPDGDALLLRHDLDGRSQLFRWEAGQLTLLITPSGHIAEARVHPSGQTWLSHSAGDEPPRLLGLPTGSDLNPPTESETTRHAPYRDVWVGRVHSLVALPRHSRGQPPAIMLLHGGPAAHDTDSYSPEVQAWLDEGFAVVLVNYTGSTGYGYSLRESIREHPGPGLRELDDITVVRSDVVRAGLVDADRVAIAGRSWGGYLALLAVGRQPDLWSLGLAAMPIADWATAYEDELPATREHDRALFGGSPAELPDFYAERSPITFADHVRAPLLMVVSRNDPHAPGRQIDNYVRRLSAAGTTFEVHEVEAGHVPRTISDQIEIQRIQVDFAVRHLTRRS